MSTNVCPDFAGVTSNFTPVTNCVTFKSGASGPPLQLGAAAGGLADPPPEEPPLEPELPELMHEAALQYAADAASPRDKAAEIFSCLWAQVRVVPPLVVPLVQDILR
jgi:hypothetical protein